MGGAHPSGPSVFFPEFPSGVFCFEFLLQMFCIFISLCRGGADPDTGQLVAICQRDPWPGGLRTSKLGSWEQDSATDPRGDRVCWGEQGARGQPRASSAAPLSCGLVEEGGRGSG